MAVSCYLTEAFMHPQERQSWFVVTVFLATLIVYLVLGAILGWGHGAEGAWGLLVSPASRV